MTVGLSAGCHETPTDTTTTEKNVAVATAPIPAAPAPAAAAANPAAMADLTPMGLPLYPNVFESGYTGDGAAALGALAGVPSKVTARIGQMSSHDSFDDVYAFYRKEMPPGSEPEAAATSGHATEEGRIAIFQIGTSGEPGYRRVMLLRDNKDDYTIINLASQGTP